MKTIIDGSRCWMDNTVKWAPTEHQRFVVPSVQYLNSELVSVMYHQCIGSFYRWKRQQHSHGPIQGMRVNWASTVFTFTSWLIYVPTGWRHLLIRHRQPLIERTIASISKMYFSHWKLPGVSERMWSVNLDASISGEYQTLGAHSCEPSE